MMLCDACAQQHSCLPARLAQQDAGISSLLKKLKKCSLQKGTPK
jgi:hypothetical protein